MKSYSARECLLGTILGTAVGIACTLAFNSSGSARTAEDIVRDFHWYYHNLRWSNIENETRWLGTSAMKTPLDLWIYQEIIHQTKPDVLIETGTNRGGSAFYYASIFDLLGRGRIYTMDVEDWPKPKHPRINFRRDSSTSDGTIAWLRSNIRAGERVMVTLDSLHTKEHVLAELNRYAPLVTPGNYLIVEDTHLNGHPVYIPFSPGPGKEGPWEAVDEWLPMHPDFVRDRAREKFGMTFNPGGWLKRVERPLRSAVLKPGR